MKESLRDDPRYKSVKHEDREVLFNEYLSDLRAAEEEVEREAKAKRDEQVWIVLYITFRKLPSSISLYISRYSQILYELFIIAFRF